jgi:hypothetical protein
MQTQTKTAPISAKKTGIKFIKGANGMELQSTTTTPNVPENVTGEQIKKAKKLGLEMLEKLAINKAEKEKRRSLTYNLNALKGSAEKYASLLGTKYDTKISIEELSATLKTPKVFLAYLSEKQKAQYEAKKLGFSYWLILGLVSKHFKANKGL